MTTLTSHDDTSAWFSTRLRALEPDVEGVEVTAVQRATRGRVARDLDGGRAGHARHDDLRLQGFVVRRDHEVGTVDPVPLEVEYGIYRRLGSTAVPVTTALWFEDDPAWAPDGRPAYVRTPGRRPLAPAVPVEHRPG